MKIRHQLRKLGISAPSRTHEHNFKRPDSIQHRQTANLGGQELRTILPRRLFVILNDCGESGQPPATRGWEGRKFSRSGALPTDSRTCIPARALWVKKRPRLARKRIGAALAMTSAAFCKASIARVVLLQA